MMLCMTANAFSQLGLSRLEYEVKYQFNVKIPMRDGVKTLGGYVYAKR